MQTLQSLQHETHTHWPSILNYSVYVKIITLNKRKPPNKDKQVTCKVKGQQASHSNPKYQEHHHFTLTKRLYSSPVHYTYCQNQNVSQSPKVYFLLTPYICVAQEFHKDGQRHKTKGFYLTSPVSSSQYHPNIQGNRNPAAVSDYISKYGNFINHKKFCQAPKVSQNDAYGNALTSDSKRRALLIIRKVNPNSVSPKPRADHPSHSLISNQLWNFSIQHTNHSHTSQIHKLKAQCRELVHHT